jgi:hypothetical protein
MESLRGVKQRFIAVVTLLIAASLALALYLFWGGSGASLDALQKQRDNLRRDVDRWQSSNPEKTRAALTEFYAANLPDRSSQISERVDKLVLDSGVTAESIHYLEPTTDRDTPPGVRQITIETNVNGDYAKIAKFINSLEQDKLFFIIDKISLTGQQSGVVSLQISFNTFLKGAA